MDNYAISDGYTVVNVIVAEDISVVENFFPDMEVFQTNGEPWIGWTLEEEGWRKPSPYPSWIWNGEDWEAPEPRPENTEFYLWEWDEENLEWKQIMIERVEE